MLTTVVYDTISIPEVSFIFFLKLNYIYSFTIMAISGFLQF